jgi:hypothetical protein
MKFDKEMIKQLVLIIVGVLAALFGYDVVTDDDAVTISVPEQVEAAHAEAAHAEASEASTEEAAEAAPEGE